ncbi:hypothetical protein MBRA1_001373 [Malassezia brasiliensis]|uniref:Uncharacterized protein n=1 Tax=Malassezia brasiliensis TaxID=1821822 RepID=A0AAF0IN55_9BASI|nr:hypothetical protein MBRA1_001373 [Malassezia brasiliensis]
MVISPSAWDTWVLGPLTAAAAAYHAAALVPSTWLPMSWRAHGYPSDVFLLLRQRTTISTQVLREALAPGGALNGLAHAWRIRFGDDALERLIWRWSSVDGRKLYLVLGAEPILGCATCVQKLDCQQYALFLLLGPYLVTLVLVALLTIPPHGVLPRLVQRIVSTPSRDAAIGPYISRAASRTPATLVILAAFFVEAYIVLRAEQLGSVYGRWEHWHANLHLARHALFLVVLTAVYFWRPVRQPAVAVIDALRSLTVTSSRVDELVAYARTASGKRPTAPTDPKTTSRVATPDKTRSPGQPAVAHSDVAP